MNQLRKLIIGLLGSSLENRATRSFGPALVGLVVVLSALQLAAPAHAQELNKEFPVERFRLAADRDGLLDVEWGAVPAHLDWDAAFWLGASDDPLIVYNEMSGEREPLGTLVTHRIAGTLIGSLALWERLQLGLEVPLIISQDQENITGIMSSDLGSVGLGDVRLAPKLRLLTRGDFHLAVLPAVTVPSGGGDDYRGDSGLTFAPEIIASQIFGAVRASLNVGYRAREETRVANLIIDDELFAHAGVGYRFDHSGSGPPLELDLTLAAATSASTPLDDFNGNHLELMGGGSYVFGNRLVGVAGAGIGLREGFGTPDWRVIVALRMSRRSAREDPDRDGLIGKADKCPLEPEDVDSFKDNDGCPDPDNDADGVLDVRDGAPMDPEDKDGFQDEDGVPDPDNDGDKIADKEDACPLEAEVVNSYQDDDGCPDELLDSDNDGLTDNVDLCPTQPEDKDAFEDENGCPDPDNDKDTVLDVDDRCINEPGVVPNQGCPDTDRDNDTVVDRLDNCPDEPGQPKNQGCPDKQLVKLTDGKLEILDKVYFATNKAIIRRRSFKLLRNAARVINAHPEIKLVQIEGHTDDRGKDDFNMDLSQRRADAVMAFLIKEGVAAERMEAKGFGETVPVADNKTAKGRAANRRVEFKTSK